MLRTILWIFWAILLINHKNGLPGPIRPQIRICSRIFYWISVFFGRWPFVTELKMSSLYCCCVILGHPQHRWLDSFRAPLKKADFPWEIQGNPGKHRIWGLGGLGGNFYCKYYYKNSPKAPYNYSASFWISNFSISFWRNPKTTIFMILGFSDVSMIPEPTIFIFGDPRTLQIIQEQTRFVYNIGGNLKILELQHFCTFGFFET